jgi:hypothetical protein
MTRINRGRCWKILQGTLWTLQGRTRLKRASRQTSEHMLGPRKVLKCTTPKGNKVRKHNTGTEPGRSIRHNKTLSETRLKLDVLSDVFCLLCVHMFKINLMSLTFNDVKCKKCTQTISKTFQNMFKHCLMYSLNNLFYLICCVCL